MFVTVKDCAQKTERQTGKRQKKRMERVGQRLFNGRERETDRQEGERKREREVGRRVTDRQGQGGGGGGIYVYHSCNIHEMTLLEKQQNNRVVSTCTSNRIPNLGDDY